METPTLTVRSRWLLALAGVLFAFAAYRIGSDFHDESPADASAQVDPKRSR